VELTNFLLSPDNEVTVYPIFLTLISLSNVSRGGVVLFYVSAGTGITGDSGKALIFKSKNICVKHEWVD